MKSKCKFAVTEKKKFWCSSGIINPTQELKECKYKVPDLKKCGERR